MDIKKRGIQQLLVPCFKAFALPIVLEPTMRTPHRYIITLDTTEIASNMEYTKWSVDCG